MSIKTAGELRGFLADVLVGIRNGKVDADAASAISKVAAQINQSLAVEVNTVLQLQRMGKEAPEAGSMLIASAPDLPPPPQVIPHDPPKALADGGGIWCEQCEMRVLPETAAACKSKHCKVRPDAVNA